MTPEFVHKLTKLGQAFTPGAPINNQDLFAGRMEQLQKIFSAVTQRGYHIVLFGERGVGKTSLANVTAHALSGNGYLVAKVTCDAGDNFSSIWRKAFREIVFNSTKPGMGFANQALPITIPLADHLPEVAQPDDIRRLLQSASNNVSVLITLDEYDRILDQQTSTLISDTIKALSDNGINATILLIGVADSVEDLIAGHQSIERALVQIPMPRMSNNEIAQILGKGKHALGMSMTVSAEEKVISLAQGVPHIAHLLGLHSFEAAIRGQQTDVSDHHVKAGINAALNQWQESIKRNYYAATKSHQPGNIYKEVLLACALSEVDELGYFTAGAIRTALQKITGRYLDIASFAQHLKAFCEADRGQVLSREGKPRQWRYRFVSPLMRPYVLMRGYTDGLVTDGMDA